MNSNSDQTDTISKYIYGLLKEIGDETEHTQNGIMTFCYVIMVFSWLFSTSGLIIMISTASAVFFGLYFKNRRHFYNNKELKYLTYGGSTYNLLVPVIKEAILQNRPMQPFIPQRNQDKKECYKVLEQYHPIW